VFTAELINLEVMVLRLKQAFRGHCICCADSRESCGEIGVSGYGGLWIKPER
jgi:hypothetical protein